jgi:hypothetical protein
MRGRERILAAFAGAKTDVTPAGIDYLTLYLAERTEFAYVDAYHSRLERDGRVRLDPDEDVQVRARALLRAYSCFQEKQDWFMVFPGPSPEAVRQRELQLVEGKVYDVDLGAGTRRQMLLSGEQAKTEEYRDHFERMRRANEERGHLERILRQHKEEALSARGDMRLVQAIVREKGEDYLIYTGGGAPFWSLYGLIGFEGMMTAMYDAPDLLVKMMDHFLETALENAQAFKDAGGHCVRIEECLASADIISPSAYETFALPYEEKLFSRLRRMGLKTILYFCGNVMPRLPYLRQLPIDALIVEESKKDFVIDIGEVRQAVGPDLCLLGNIDSYEIVLKATEARLTAEVERQIRVAGHEGRFIVGVGSPITLDTPPSRVDLLIHSAHRHVT